MSETEIEEQGQKPNDAFRLAMLAVLMVNSGPTGSRVRTHKKIMWLRL